jgi:hypothetical protein
MNYSRAARRRWGRSVAGKLTRGLLEGAPPPPPWYLHRGWHLVLAAVLGVVMGMLLRRFGVGI